MLRQFHDGIVLGSDAAGASRPHDMESRKELANAIFEWMECWKNPNDGIPAPGCSAPSSSRRDSGHRTRRLIPHPTCQENGASSAAGRQHQIRGAALGGVTVHSTSRPSRGGCEQAEGAGPLYGLVAAVHAELGVEVPHVQFVAHPLLPPLSAPLIRAFPHPRSGGAGTPRVR